MAAKKKNSQIPPPNEPGEDPAQGDLACSDVGEMVRERVRQIEAETAKEKGYEPSSDFVRSCLYANELGDGELFAALYLDRFVFNASAGEWFEWSGSYWKRDVCGAALAAVDEVARVYLREAMKTTEQIQAIVAGGSEGDTGFLAKIRTALERRVKKLRSTKGRTACLEFARTCSTPLIVPGEHFDSRPWLLACANGVIDLQRGIFTEGRPGDYLSMASPVEWKGIDTPAPLWEKTLREIFHENLGLISFMKRYLGYSLTGSTRDNVFLLLYGQGRNGKTLLVSILSYILGPLARPIPSEMLLDQGRIRNSAGPSPDVMMLRGLRIAFASESDEGRRFNAGRVKLFSGGDELTARNPHDKFPITFAPSHKLMLLTNEKPSAPASDFAFWERLLLVSFNVSFVNREPQKFNEKRANKDLLAQLQEEASGILAWLVWGCLEWQKEGLTPPQCVTEATEQYRRDEDIIADFIDERLVREPGVVGFSSDIYTEFTAWYEANIGKRVPSQHWLGKQLHKTYEKTKRDGRIAYLGIAVR